MAPLLKVNTVGTNQGEEPELIPENIHMREIVIISQYDIRAFHPQCGKTCSAKSPLAKVFTN